MTDFAPFPEAGIAKLAVYHDDVASNIQSAFVAGLHTDRAEVCRNALAAHLELRDRFLEQEMTVRRLQARVNELETAIGSLRTEAA